MYARMHMHVHAAKCSYTHVCMHTHMYACTYTCIHACTCTCICTHTCLHLHPDVKNIKIKTIDFYVYVILLQVSEVNDVESLWLLHCLNAI